MAAHPASGAVSGVHVVGLRELQKAMARAGKDARKETRDALRAIAEPIQHDAEQLAQEKITNIGRRWYKMRIGVTRSLIYVAPQQRGRQSARNVALKRPLFATLLMEKAMDPALAMNVARIEQEFDNAMERVWDHFERAA